MPANDDAYKILQPLKPPDLYFIFDIKYFQFDVDQVYSESANSYDHSERGSKPMTISPALHRIQRNGKRGNRHSFLVEPHTSRNSRTLRAGYFDACSSISCFFVMSEFYDTKIIVAVFTFYFFVIINLKVEKLFKSVTFDNLQNSYVACSC